MIEYNKKIKVNVTPKDNEYKTKQNNYLSIYYNFNEYNIDRLQLRKQPRKERSFFTSPAGTKCKSMHIVVDMNDLSKSIRTMFMLCNNKNEKPIYYYLDIKSNVVRKLKEVVRYYKKHNLQLDYNLVYYGTKSKATRKLENLMK